MKILAGRREAVLRDLLCFDFWSNETRRIKLNRERIAPQCPTCRGEFDFLSGKYTSMFSVLCGKNAVQIQPQSGRLDLKALAERLRQHGTVDANPFLVRFTCDEHTLTIFGDGRVIVAGTTDPAVARTLHARWIGS
jgi:adenylyltransferase/sulfurtransferase